MPRFSNPQAPQTIIRLRFADHPPSDGLRLSRAFHTTPDLWLTLQKNYDLWQAENGSKAWQMVKPISPQSLHVN